MTDVLNYIYILFVSMLPITELRFSIPYGILVLELSGLYVVIISILGNIFIGIVVIYIIGPVMNLLRKNKYFNYIIETIFKRTRVNGRIIQRLKFYGLIIFVGIPLPFTGVWTGSLASYLFGLSRTKSIIAITLGVLVSAAIVTTLTLFTNQYI